MKRIIYTVVQFITHRQTKRAFYIWLALVIFQVIILGLWWKRLPPQIPLFYSRPWGEQQLVPLSYLIILPVASIVVEVINAVFAMLIFHRERFLVSVLVWSAVLATVLATISLVKVVFLVS